jgi:hypothetical protein
MTDSNGCVFVCVRECLHVHVCAYVCVSRDKEREISPPPFVAPAIYLSSLRVKGSVAHQIIFDAGPSYNMQLLDSCINCTFFHIGASIYNTPSRYVCQLK